MSKDAGNRFVQTLVLTERLTQPSPKRDEGAEDALAVFVAFIFQHAQDVFSLQQPTEGQTGVFGKCVTDLAEIFSRHDRPVPFVGANGRIRLWGRILVRQSSVRAPESICRRFRGFLFSSEISIQ